MKEIRFELNKKVTEVKESERKRTASFQPDWVGGEITGAEPGKYFQDKVALLEKELDQTRDEAFQAGFADGKEYAMREFASKLDEYHTLCVNMQKEFRQAMENMEGPLLKLAQKMAEKIIGAEISKRTEKGSVLVDSKLMEKLKQLLYEVIDQQNVVIEIHPVHQEWLRSPDLVKECNLPETMKVSIVGNPVLKPGECVIRTEQYHIDETYHNQAQQMVQQLGAKD